MVGYGGDRCVLCNFGVEGWLLVTFPEALTGIKSCNVVAGGSQKAHHCENGEAGEGVKGEKGECLPTLTLVSDSCSTPLSLLFPLGFPCGFHCPAQRTQPGAVRAWGFSMLRRFLVE